MVIIGAGLSAIPRDVLEAARTDGATECQAFRRVTIPLLMPVLTVVFVTQIIGVLKIFDLIYRDRAGIDAERRDHARVRDVEQSFSGQNKFGLGAAIAVVHLRCCSCRPLLPSCASPRRNAADGRRRRPQQPAPRSVPQAGEPDRRGIHLASAPVNVFLLFVGLLWIIPAFGLFVHLDLLPAESRRGRLVERLLEAERDHVRELLADVRQRADHARARRDRTGDARRDDPAGAVRGARRLRVGLDRVPRPGPDLRHRSSG